MATQSRAQPMPSFWSGLFKKRATNANVEATATATRKPSNPQQESTAPMRSYKPRYAQRDALRCISAQEREEAMKADRRARSDTCSETGFSTDAPPLGKMPIHPSYQSSLSGMPFYVAAPLTHSAPSSPASVASSKDLRPIPASDTLRLPSSSASSTKSASGRLESGKSDDLPRGMGSNLSLAELRSELQAEYQASKRSPREFDRNIDFRLAHSGFFSAGRNLGPQFSTRKAKKRAMDLKLPGSLNYMPNGFTPPRSGASSILSSTPEVEEVEWFPHTPSSAVERKSQDSAASSVSSMTERSSRQISESGTVDTEISQVPKGSQ